MSDALQVGHSVRTAKATAADAFDPVFTGWNRVAYGFGILCWLTALGYFWIWWCQSAHIISGPPLCLSPSCLHGSRSCRPISS